MKLLSILLICAIIFFVIWFLFTCNDDWCGLFAFQKERMADSFERCVALGFPIMESHPRQCRAGDKLFVEKGDSPQGNQNIIIDSPVAGEVIKSPLKITGKARGPWYFEASFPVRLVDAAGKEIAIAVAQAKGEWMTENFVEFEVVMPFSNAETDTGKLIFEKDNPSGLPQFADSFTLPVRFR